MWIRGDIGRAEVLYERVLAAQSAIHGANSVQVAATYQQLAAFETVRFAFDAAQALYERALEVYAAMGMSEDASVTGVLFGMLWMTWQRGDAERAMALEDRILGLYEKVYGPESAALPTLLGAFAFYSRLWGTEERARAHWLRAARLHDQALAQLERDKGPMDPALVGPLTQLAGVHQALSRFQDAEALFRRARAIEETAYGEDALASTGTRMQLGSLYQAAGRYADAAIVYEEVHAIQVKAWGERMAASSLSVLADIYAKLGRHADAALALAQVERAYAGQFGASHPNTGHVVERLGLAELDGGHAARGLALLERSEEIFEAHIRLVLSTGTEADNLSFMRSLGYQVGQAVGVHTRRAPGDPRAAAFALTRVLRRKGRVQDAVSDSARALRQHLTEQDRALLDRLGVARSRLAKLVVVGPQASAEGQYVQDVAALEADVRQLEREVRERSAVFRVQTAPVTVDSVRELLPGDGALVEWIRVEPPPTWGQPPAPDQEPARYVAYVLRRDRPIEVVELADAAGVDAAVARLREALSSPRRDDVVERSREVHDRLFAPLEPLLRDARLVVLSPDGPLNLVPFAALTDRAGRPLVRRFVFAYVTSGRDLLRGGVRVAPEQGPTLFADPDFDGDGAAPEVPPEDLQPRAPSRRSRDLAMEGWKRLPGTAEEVSRIREMLDGAVVFEGARATESAVKALRRPELLHIATHGFFLAPDTRPTVDAPSLAAVAAPAPPSSGGPENPLLRSGLALAAANKLDSGSEDGMLTALEAAGLDLWGTRLVTLSACETGVGDVRVGEGVYGLRRALLIAGAEALLMTLWQVDDAATRDLVVAYYRRLSEGAGRAEALRDAQLTLVDNPALSHPYYWASFIPLGEWTPMVEE
jgi:CHAT domain-containing protein